MHPVRLSIFAGVTATALGVLSALAGPAAATVGATRVPAARVPAASGPFKIGPANSAGTVALTANGGKVAVFDIKSGLGKTHVCLIAPTGRTCWHSTYLLPPASTDNTFGRPGVFTPSAGHVVVLQQTCCEVNPNSTVLYTSSDGGKTFSAPVRVGALGVDASELIGGQILYTSQNNAGGLQVVSVPVAASGPRPTARISSRVAYDVGLGQYKGSALVGTDFIGSTYTTYLYHAAKGSNFDVATSYSSVAKFAGESLLAMSGGALLTDRVKGDAVLLRMFNGTAYGPAHVVAHIHGGLGTWLTVNQDPSGHVHVFAIMSTANYHMLEVSTSTGGTAWTRATDLGNAISSTALSAATDSTGRGLVLGTVPAWGYPVP
ncbi:MAG TPA: hypothetical protein VF834_05870 [Streptosporangiaceae bacterium]